MTISKVMILTGLMVSTIYAGIAQNPKQANIWYFGTQAGLDFTHGNPVAVTSSMSAHEGTAVICDDNGNLLFYTNGGNQPNTGAIWNKRHQVMPNGYLEDLAGCSSSIQSSVIVKMPGSESIYYVFNTDCYENSFANGLTYSIVDMNLDGGLGDVVTKGEFLAPNVTESLAAAVHSNGKDYWIITHPLNTDSFFVFQLTSIGITGVIKTKIGPVAGEFVGELKVSANGQRLAFGGNTFAAVFDFDASSGIISNFRSLGARFYTVCFSPNCELLYGVDFFDREIFQFDLLVYDINASKRWVGSSTDYIGSMQLGPDNKIYIAIKNSPYIGVITRPNIRGPYCNFIKNDIYLNGKTSKYGLPNYPNNVLGECKPYPVENVSKYDPQFMVRKIDATEITLEFNPLPEASGYRISRRKAGANTWENFTVQSNIMDNENLEENTRYEFRMDAIAYPGYTFEFIHNHDYDQVISRKEKGTPNVFEVSTSDALVFELYPNPAKEQANVDVYLKKNSDVEILITDLSGKVMIHKNVQAKSGFQQITVPLDDIQNGIYQLSLKYGNMNGYKKLVVVN